MGADHSCGEFDSYESWSNWICPSCNTWFFSIDGYEKMEGLIDGS